MNFESGKIPHIFFKIFIPTMVGMVFSSLFLITDGIFVGKGVGDDAFASVNLTMPIYTVMTGLCLMFGAGGSILASSAMGLKQYRRAQIFGLQSIYAGVAVMTLLAILILVFKDFTITMMGTPDAFRPLVSEYLTILVAFFPMNATLVIGMFLVRIDGAPNCAAASQIVSAVLNIVLDYLFIFEFDMGIKGAALATGLAETMGALVIIYYLVFRANIIRYRKIRATLANMIFSIKKISVRIVTVGFSPFVGELSISVMVVLSNFAFRERYGDSGVVAFSVVANIFPVIYMLYMAVIQSAQPIISFNFSAGMVDRVRQSFRLVMVVTSVLGLCLALFMSFCSDFLVGLFLDRSSDAFHIACDGLPIFAIGSIFFGINTVFLGYIQSLGKATSPSILMLIRGVVLMSISYLLFPTLVPSIGVWLAIPVAEIAALFIIVVYYRNDNK